MSMNPDKNLELRRKILKKLQVQAEKHDLSVFAVVTNNDGSGGNSVYSAPKYNKHNQAVKRARKKHMEWERKNNIDPNHDWSKEARVAYTPEQVERLRYYIDQTHNAQRQDLEPASEATWYSAPTQDVPSEEWNDLAVLDYNQNSLRGDPEERLSRLNTKDFLKGDGSVLGFLNPLGQGSKNEAYQNLADKYMPKADAYFDKYHPSMQKTAKVNIKDRLQKLREAKEAGHKLKSLKEVLKMKNFKINVDRPLGKYRGGKDWAGMVYPINYGEIPGVINPSDGDPWDIIVPGPITPKKVLKVKKIIGYVPLTDGNHKLVGTYKAKTRVNLKQVIEFVKRRRRQALKNNDDHTVKDLVIIP